MKSLIGKNALTVLLTESIDESLKMFFCPYTRNNVSQYIGNVEVIFPGYDTNQNPSVITRPQRLAKNINYVFTNTKGKQSDSTSFWIQYRLFDEAILQVYYCSNCQAPQLYYSDTKVVNHCNKSELKHGDEYVCPNCKNKFKYMGTVNIGLPDII